METKTYPLRVLLTVTTGRLLTAPRGDRDNGIKDLYDILGWMTNDSPFTHQLPRFGDECRPWLLRWFPELAKASGDVSLNMLDKLINAMGAAAINAWLEEVRVAYSLKEEYDVPRIPADDHEQKHPYDELVAMRGTDEGIIVIDKDSAQ